MGVDNEQNGTSAVGGGVIKVAIVLGTRPEIIKMAPMIKACAGQGVECHIIHTGQHYSYGLHLRLAEQEGLGVSDLRLMDLNSELPEPRRFKVLRTLTDRLAAISCSRYTITKLVYDSPLTPLIYLALRRERPRRVV